MSEDVNETSAKRVAFYSALVEAWLGTRMERDRTLLVLSSGGLGLLASILIAKETSSCLQLALSFFSALSFLVVVFALLTVFRRNTGVLEDAMNGGEGKDQVLELLDKVAMWGFIVGVVGTLMLAFSYAISSTGGTKMSAQRPRKDGVEKTVGDSGEKHGYSGVGSIRPDGGGNQGTTGSGGGDTGSNAGAAGAQSETGQQAGGEAGSKATD